MIQTHRATAVATSLNSARHRCNVYRPTISTSTRSTGPCSDIPIDETLRALDDLIRAGKVRYIGSSTFAAWQVVESLWASKELGLNRFICEQPPYHLLDRSIERELIPMAQTYGTALIPWSPMAGGFLTGKYRRGEARPGGFTLPRREPRQGSVLRCRVQGFGRCLGDFIGEGLHTESVLIGVVRPAAGDYQPIVGVPHNGSDGGQLGAIDVEVTDEDRERIDEVAPPGGVITPYYRADFGPHLFRW